MGPSGLGSGARAAQALRTGGPTHLRSPPPPPSPHLSSFSWSRSSRAPSSRSSRCLALSSPQSSSARPCPEGSRQAVSPQQAPPAGAPAPAPECRCGPRPGKCGCRFTTAVPRRRVLGAGQVKTEGKPQPKKAAQPDPGPREAPATLKPHCGPVVVLAVADTWLSLLKSGQ